MKAIDIEASRERMSRAMAKLAKERTVGSYSMKAFMDRQVAKAGDELEREIIQEPQEPEAVPCGWAEMCRQMDEVLDDDPSQAWRRPLDFNRNAPGLRCTANLLDDVSVALPPRRPMGETMIVFDDERPEPDSKAYPQCHVDARCVKRQGSGMYCGDQKCEVRMMFVSYEDSMKE